MSKRSFACICAFVSVILLVVLVAGCGSKVSQANFEKIQTGMTHEEVRGILGEPTESSSLDIGGLSGTSSVWKTNEATISITFLNNKVTTKEFSKSGN